MKEAVKYLLLIRLEHLEDYPKGSVTGTTLGSSEEIAEVIRLLEELEQ